MNIKNAIEALKLGEFITRKSSSIIYALIDYKDTPGYMCSFVSKRTSVAPFEYFTKTLNEFKDHLKKTSGTGWVLCDVNGKVFGVLNFDKEGNRVMRDTHGTRFINYKPEKTSKEQIVPKKVQEQVDFVLDVKDAARFSTEALNKKRVEDALYILSIAGKCITLNKEHPHYIKKTGNDKYTNFSKAYDAPQYSRTLAKLKESFYKIENFDYGVYNLGEESLKKEDKKQKMDPEIAREQFVNSVEDKMKKDFNERMEKVTYLDKFNELSFTPISDYLKSGVKESLDNPKLPMYTVLMKQFPLALQEVAKRSVYGHEKYKEHDKDWMNFKRVPGALEEYKEAAVRHLMEMGPETAFEHKVAAAWNLLGIIQIECESRDANKNR